MNLRELKPSFLELEYQQQVELIKNLRQHRRDVKASYAKKKKELKLPTTKKTKVTSTVSASKRKKTLTAAQLQTALDLLKGSTE